MTDEQLDEWERLEQAAAKGPWSTDGWDVYDSLPGLDEEDSWINVEDRSSGIEVQYTGHVVQAYSGQHLVELDSHGEDSNSTMYQEVYLRRGIYQLAFAYRPRNEIAGDNAIQAKINGRTLITLNGVDNSHWSVKRVEFKMLISTESSVRGFSIGNSGM